MSDGRGHRIRGMRERPYLAEAIRNVRARRDIEDIPDEAVARLAVTQWWELGLALRAFGHACVAAARR